MSSLETPGTFKQFMTNIEVTPLRVICKFIWEKFRVPVHIHDIKEMTQRFPVDPKHT